nr:hypothetical protein Iba_chr14fCG6460 [Ipomoea batatas]
MRNSNEICLSCLSEARGTATCRREIRGRHRSLLPLEPVTVASPSPWKRGHVAVGLRAFRGSCGGSVKEAVIGDLFQDLLKIGEEVGGGGMLYDRDGGGAL